MRHKLCALAVAAVATLATVLPAQTSDAAPTTYQLKVTQFCKSFGHHMSCTPGYHDFAGTITHYQARVSHFRGLIGSGAGTSCTHAHLTYWELQRGDTVRVNIETTAGTAKGSTGSSKRLGTVNSTMNTKPFRITLTSHYYDDPTIFINGTFTCTTKTGEK